MSESDDKTVKFEDKVETRSLKTEDFRMSVVTGDFLEGEQDNLGLTEDEKYNGGHRPTTRSADARIPSTTGQPRFARTPATSGRETSDTLQELSSQQNSDNEDSESEASFLITEVKELSKEMSDIVPWDGLRMRDSKNAKEESSSDSDYDTDLEADETTPEHDPTGRSNYLEICERLGVVPASYFARHITEPEIVMRHHGLGGMGARAIAKCFKSLVTCEKLDLSANWIGEAGGKYMAKMVKENDYISELGLADNVLSHGGAEHFCKMLQENVTLRSVDLSGNSFTDKEADFFAEAIEENKYLKNLNLSRNFFGETAGIILGPAIGANDVMESLDLSWNQIRQRGAVAIARGLKENIRIKVCNLSWNGLGPEGGVALADALTANEALTELDISGNRIDSYAAELIGKAVSKNDLLKVLKMGNNPISTNSLVVLANYIKKSDITVLEHLDLSDIPVEYEYLNTVFEIKQAKPDFVETHGPVMRSGNTQTDVGKLGIDPKLVTNPIVVLREHIVVKDVRILEILQNYDKDHSYSVSQEDFANALKDLGVPFDKKQLLELSNRLGDNNGKIFYGDILKQLEKTRTTEENSDATPGIEVET